MTHKLGGANYVFWGGREGYSSLLNTDVKRELDHMAAFFHLAIAHKKNIRFEGQLLIEPKPKEPVSKHAAREQRENERWGGGLGQAESLGLTLS